MALCIDWGLCLLISHFLFQDFSLATLSIFFVEQVLLVSTLGYSIGHRVMNIQVVRFNGVNRPFSPVGPLAGLVRALLLVLVLPAAIVDADHRGLHDRAMATVLVRR